MKVCLKMLTFEGDTVDVSKYYAFVTKSSSVCEKREKKGL